MIIFWLQMHWSKWRNWLAPCLVAHNVWVWVQIPFHGKFFKLFIYQFTVMKFQLIAVEYRGLKFTKGVFNLKPKRFKIHQRCLLYLQILSNIKNSQFMSYRTFWGEIFILCLVLFSMSFERFPFSMFDKICKFWNDKF